MTELELVSTLIRWTAFTYALYLVQRRPHPWTFGALGLVSLLVVSQVGIHAFEFDVQLAGASRFGYAVGSLAISTLLLGGVGGIHRALRSGAQAGTEVAATPPGAETESQRETLRSRAKQQEAVANLGRRILASTKVEESVHDAVHTVARTLSVSGSSIFEYAYHRRSLILRAGAGRMSDYLGTALAAASESHLGVALLQEQRVIVDDFDESPMRRPQILPYAQARSAVAVVISGRERPYGVLAAHAAEAGRFSEEDAHFIQGVANLLAATIEQERSRAEIDRNRERAIQSQKLEALGRLSGGIAHDFNNMLHAIVGNTEITLSGLGGDSAYAHNLRQVLATAQRARALVQQVLTFSLQGRPERSPVEVESIVDEVVVLMKGYLPSEVRIYKTIRHPGAMVVADSTQIYQVLVNLCTNAGHAMPAAGGEIEVSIDSVELTQSQARELGLRQGRYVSLAVRDTGHGIRPEIRDRIFDPFFSAGSAPGVIGEGTGMGLAVVHGIVDSHQGRVRVESEPGHGARFEVFLPQTTEAVVSEPPQESPQRVVTVRSGTEAIRVLFVDDEPALVQMTEQGLGDYGFEVTGLRSSASALEQFRSDPHAYDVVVMDQNMPELRGDALAKEMLQVRADIPIILCTGYANEVTPEELRAIGVREYLSKPLTIDRLANVIRRVAGVSAT